MKVRLICVGKLKEKYLKAGIQEYSKRLSKYTKFEIIEVKDEATKENLSEKEKESILNKEGDRLLSKVKPEDYVYVLEINGKLMTSEEFASSMNDCMVHDKPTIDFIIGGSLGTSEAVNQRANCALSFGRMTLPHQLMRLVLTEQIYRAFRIIHHEPYHK